MKLVARSHPRTPERLVDELAAQLRKHFLRDGLLVSLPPLLAAQLLAAFLYRLTWIGPASFLAIVVAAIGAGLLAVVLRYRSAQPSPMKAARLVDERAGAKDHFLTLTTIGPSPSAASLLARLRSEAASYQDRIEIERDFPYRIKKSFYRSLALSAGAGLCLYLLLVLLLSSHTVPAPQRLRELAQKMAERPRLSELARGLQALATKLEDLKSPPEQQRAATQEIHKRIEAQQKKEPLKEDQDLLSEASGTLAGLERQSGAGQERQPNQEQGGGGNVQSNLPQEGEGETKQSQGTGGDKQGEPQGARLSKRADQEKSVSATPQDGANPDKQRKGGEEKNQQADANKSEKNQNKEAAGKNEAGSESGGKGKSSDEIPRRAPPAERSYAGNQEGKEGIKNARYVTVQLPEEMAAGTSGKGGDGSGTKSGKNGKAQPKVPVSNIPLPAHIPDAPAEKQPMPLEYRGMIR